MEAPEKTPLNPFPLAHADLTRAGGLFYDGGGLSMRG
jgi:hypothetical protein